MNAKNTQATLLQKNLALACIGVHYKVDLDLKTFRCIQNVYN